MSPAPTDSFPQINFGEPINGIDETDIGYGISNYYVAKVFQYNDSVSWSKGRHLFKFGGEPRFIGHEQPRRPRLSRVQLQPGADRHARRAARQIRWGSDLPAFSSDEVARASQHVPADFSGSRNYAALFAQDDFRVSNRLTLNLGLRWETTRAGARQTGDGAISIRAR